MPWLSEGEKLDRFFDEFEISFAAGHWCAGDFADRFGVPIVNLHVNNAKLHSNDEDRIAGTGDTWRLADFCYAAIDTGYQGWFGEDQFTYRTEPVKSMALSREFFGNVMKKALRIYAVRDRLEEAQSTGDALATLEVVKKYLI